jgi:hypothetical protein
MSEAPDSHPLADRSFRGDQWGPLLIVFGGAGVLATFFLPVTTGGLIAVSVAMVALGIWKLCSAYVTLRADCFETKLAPAAGWHTVLYSEVTSVERDGNILNIHYRKHGSHDGAKPVHIKLRLGEMGKTEREHFVEAFFARLPKKDIA